MIQAVFEGKEQVVMVVTFSNTCPVSSRPKESIAYEAIGHVANEFGGLPTSAQ